MPTKLNLLIVEDDPNDAELAIAELENNGFQCTWDRVETKDAFLTCLDEKPYDLILSDYSMPAFDGMTALKLMQEHRVEIPFILISGTVGEEVAIDSLKAGATDYVMKGRLSRLGPVIKRARQEEELRQERERADKALRESEEKLKIIIENSTNMFYSHTPDHVLTYVSPQVKDILGYEEEEVLVRWTELATDHPVNEQGFERTVKAIETGEVQPPYELQLRHKDGRPVWVEVHEAPVVENGKTVAIVGSLNDITERKAAEKQLRESKAFLQSTLDGLTAHIALLDENGTILLVNKAWRNFAEQNGLDAKHACEGSNYIEACESATESCRNDAVNFATGLKAVVSGQTDSFRLEYPCSTQTKNYWFAANVSRFDQADSRRAVVFHTDITATKIAEAELKNRMNDLERFNKASVGRELRMIELKKEVNALCRELGREEPYA